MTLSIAVSINEKRYLATSLVLSQLLEIVFQIRRSALKTALSHMKNNYYGLSDL